MIWFHTVALPLGTMLLLWVGAKKKVPKWKLGALVAGCGLMLSGLWLRQDWSTLLLVAGGVLFVLGVPRGKTSPSAGG